MNQVPSIERSDSIDTMFANEGDFKALCMAWDACSDEFYFRLAQSVRYDHTKAGMLSVVASRACESNHYLWHDVVSKCK